MSRTTIHRDSVEYLNVPVTPPSGVVITTQPVALAILPKSDGDPATADWHTAAWAPGPTAQLLVGTAPVVLTPGVYTVFVRVTDNPEIPVLKAGSITVT